MPETIFYRYLVVVLVRPNDNDGPEQEYEARVTAINELCARRVVLEQAWAAGLLVSRFFSVQCGGEI